MQLPDGLYLGAAARGVRIVLKGQANDVDRERRHNVTQLRECAEGDFMGGKLRLETLTRRAIFRVAGDFHDGPRGGRIRHVGYFRMNIAVALHFISALHKSVSDMK